MKTLGVKCAKCDRIVTDLYPSTTTTVEYNRIVRQTLAWVCWSCKTIGW